jgi:hypothetical protein
MSDTVRDANLIEILRVCQELKAKGFEPLAGKWIRGECERQGIPLHASQLGKLARMGCLSKGQTSHRGNRRYYWVTSVEPTRPVPNTHDAPPQLVHPGAKLSLGPNPAH